MCVHACAQLAVAKRKGRVDQEKANRTGRVRVVYDDRLRYVIAREASVDRMNSEELRRGVLLEFDKPLLFDNRFIITLSAAPVSTSPRAF